MRIVSALTIALTFLSTATAQTPHWHELIASPDPAFTQIPLWFWNDDLDDDEIKRQMADFRAHGVHGFMIHARMGLPKSIGFMSDRWLGHVRTALEEAARTGMRVCLYDEFMYPSGSAHGEVARSNPEFAAQSIQMVAELVNGPAKTDIPRPKEGIMIAVVLSRLQTGTDTLDPATLRCLPLDQTQIDVPAGDWRVMIFTQVPSQGHIRGVHEGEDDRQPDAPPAADLLNPEAMRQFIRLAYDPYDQVASLYYGQTVIGMFTDEPSMLGRGHRKGVKPWTAGFEEYFSDRRGYDLLTLLPALFLDVGEQTSQIRRDFERTLIDRLDETYYALLAQWCDDRNISLTGHPAHSDEISLLRRFHIPGQDIVWRWAVPDNESALEGPNSTVGKCTSSAARHDGRRRNSNELYGAYGWQLTMDEMKWLADWLMVRGVNLLYPHAFYYSMRGYRAMERPPDVGPNNAWWPHYRLFADYTSRVCKLLTDSRQVCEVAIVGKENGLPWRVARFLFENQVDFNYVEPSRLVEETEIGDGRLRIGDMAYTVLIVDQDEPLDEALSRRLAAFAQAGGRVKYCRGTPSVELLAGIDRHVQIAPPDPGLRYIHVRKHGVDFYLFVNEGEGKLETQVTVRSVGRAEWFDAWTGEFRPASKTSTDGEEMTLLLDLDRRGSVVLCVDPSSRPDPEVPRPLTKRQKAMPLDVPWRVEDSRGRRVGDGLGNWLEREGMEKYTGTLTYGAKFVCDRREKCEYTIDLGQVGDFAVLRLNGNDLGVKLWAPFEWDITGEIRDGENELVVEVTNSLSNRYTPDKPRPSGLIGPVTVHATEPAPSP